MKRLLIFMAVIIMASFVSVSAYASGWNIINSGTGTAEICECTSISGKALHVETQDTGEITVSHIFAGTGSVKRDYRVTFYMSGDYDENKIMVGAGTKTTASNPIAITYMPVSHEKIEKSEYSDGWIKYTYVFRGDVENNADFKFVFGSGAGEVYLDNVSIIFEESSEDKGYSRTGQGILAGGEFESEITADIGFPIENYGWTSNISTVQTTGAASAGDAITPVVRVIEAADGERMLYAKYNARDWTDNSLILTKKIEKTGWEEFYVTFKVKGAFAPSSVMVGSTWLDKIVKLVNGDGSSEGNPYGDNVTAEPLEDGWTKYTVKTYGEGTEIKIKIHSLALEMYIDDFEVVTAAGVKKNVPNPGFEGIDYNSQEAFAEAWTAKDNGETAFVQRAEAMGGYAVFMMAEGDEKNVGFYQTISGLTDGEEYTVSFDARSGFEKNAITVGFGDTTAEVTGDTFTRIGNKKQTYSFTAQATGDKVIFVTSGECGGVWIDNVSVKSADGSEMLTNGDFEIKTLPPVFTVENVRLIKAGEESDIGVGSYTVKADIENNFGEEDMEFTLILSHDRNGEMIKYEESELLKLDPSGGDGEPTVLSCDIELYDYEYGDTLEVYIWDNNVNITSRTPYVVFD